MSPPTSPQGTALNGELVEEIAAVAVAAGCELVHAEFHGCVLRVFLDRSEGEVNLDDCSRVSREVSALLDVLDFGSERYTLEVSSPGLDRQLYGPRDYERFRGRLVRVTHREAETRAKRTVVGRLEEFAADPGRITVEATADRQTQRHTIDLDDVLVARLEIEL